MTASFLLRRPSTGRSLSTDNCKRLSPCGSTPIYSPDGTCREDKTRLSTPNTQPSTSRRCTRRRPRRRSRLRSCRSLVDGKKLRFKPYHSRGTHYFEDVLAGELRLRSHATTETWDICHRRYEPAGVPRKASRRILDV